MTDLESYELRTARVAPPGLQATWSSSSMAVSFDGLHSRKAAEFLRHWLASCRPARYCGVSFGLLHADHSSGVVTAEPLFYTMSDQNGVVPDGWFVSEVAIWLVGLIGGPYTVFGRSILLDE